MSTGQSVGNPLLEIEWEPCLLEKKRAPELERFVKRELGVMPPVFSCLTRCPWVVRAEVYLRFDGGLLMHIGLDLANLVSMAASLEGACRCCYATGRFFLRLQGKSESKVRELEQMLVGSAPDPRVRAAIAFARRMSRSDPLVNAADLQALRDTGFSPQEISELAYVVAYTVFVNRVATLPALSPYEVEAMPDKWLARLLRPLIARKLLKNSRPGKPVDSVPGYEGPYSYLLDIYAPSPIAVALSKTLNGVWEDSTLTRRCKGLMLAVVAHTLGCSRTAQEAEQMLAGEGLPEGTLQEVLDHLRSPALDETEALLVSFARKTVWYRPAQVQREARRTLGQLDQARFTEAVGILALANALCRLGAAVAEDP